MSNGSRDVLKLELVEKCADRVVLVDTVKMFRFPNSIGNVSSLESPNLVQLFMKDCQITTFFPDKTHFIALAKHFLHGTCTVFACPFMTFSTMILSFL